MAIPYQFKSPKKIYQLQLRLKEISGLQAGGKQRAFCVEDEHKNIYRYDLKIKSLTAVYGKDKPADVEDLVILGKKAYLLLAKRRQILLYKDFHKSMAKPQKIDLKLKKAYDPEGMCYCPTRKALLVACKGDPDDVHKRSVFSVDLKKQKRLNNPLFKINAKNLQAYQAGKSFNPSAIAIHPKSQEIYLLGTRSLKLLLRLAADGKKVLSEQLLDQSIYKQPEGMDFLENGDLLIASEGRGRHKASIYLLQQQ